MEKELLRYGEILTDDEFIKNNINYRIRTISYNNNVYYLKMRNGVVKNLIKLN